MLIKLSVVAIVGAIGAYFLALGLFAGFPPLQTHLFYLHRVTLTWFKDLNVPEQFGFLHNQVTTFYIDTVDGQKLHAWHVLPLNAYLRHEKDLLQEPYGPAEDVTSTTGFQLLRDDPGARLVVYFHGTAGCIASGWRPDSYRTLSSAAPDKIHVLSFDYRGYGLSSGIPTEDGLLTDAIAVVEWAINVAGIPPDHIVIYAQSLGTAVAISASQYFASRSPPIAFAGQVLSATFSDVATLTATYRISGIIPVLSPIAKVPLLLDFFNSFLTNTWMSKDRIADFIRLREDSQTGGRYHLNLIHAEDDADITCQHSNVMYWHTVNATSPVAIKYEELEEEKSSAKLDLGFGGWQVEHRTSRGLIRLQMLKYGKHNKIMSYPVAGAAVIRAFQDVDPTFNKQDTPYEPCL